MRPGYFLLIVLLLSLQSGFSQSLSNRYSEFFTIGVAITPRSTTTDEAKLIVSQFNSVTAENAMKMGPVHPQEDQYNWAGPDSIVAFAQSSGMKVRGHTLVWHNQTPAWIFKDANGQEVNKEILLKRLKEHITTVVTRYRGKIYAWDVVNEAISDNPNEYLRNSNWLKICGPEYINLAFQWAHDADPDAILFYNDYNETDPVKREKIYRLISELKSQGVPVSGLGLQAHWNIYHPSAAQIDSALQLYSKLNVNLQVTELDLSVYPSGPDSTFKPGTIPAEFTPQQEQKQIEKYREIFAIFRKYKKQITSITFWNISDRRSWLDNFPVRGRKNYPLLFDKDLKPKRAFDAVMNFQ
ncbi:endo-1,4-beta-xylanase [Pollutibacter soli]|uniref:endo-1,4-beta-xylanase n=1 Tax=Pollutibacter soli TaxID=3034157 RepID=UPI003013AE57